MNRLGIGVLAAVCVIGSAGCDSSQHTNRSAEAPKQANESVLYAVDIRSPDGKRVAVVRRVGSTYYLEVGPVRGGPRHTIYRSRSMTTDVFWASHLIAFGDGNEVKTIDVRTRRIRRIVIWATSFNISSDGRWIAWTKTGSPHTPDAVGLVPIAGGKCLLVPRPSNRADSLAFFKPGVKRVFFRGSPSARALVKPPPAEQSACRCRACDGPRQAPAEPERRKRRWHGPVFGMSLESGGEA